MALADFSGRLISWLENDALPLWARVGFDGPGGGLAETVALDGTATRDDRRGRVPPRQAYAFAEAGLKGWGGDWRLPAEAALSSFDRVFARGDGFYGAVATADGVLTDPSFDLYIQAFAFLALATLAEALPERRAELSARSDAMRQALVLRCKHPEGGFHEDDPRRYPLRANPHMHLFEACMASETVEGFDRTAWSKLADDIAELALSRLIDAESGVLREFFDVDWTPFPGPKGRKVEPGHLFEWSWLLSNWGERRGNERALAASKRLFDLADAHGVCPERNVAMMGLLDDLSVADPLARLWSQTEWLKAAVRLAARVPSAGQAPYLASAVSAARAFERFLDTPLPGLWRDKMLPDGRFVEEAAPASSLYHIVCAAYELRACLLRLQAD
ncbi:AGE family epimerase/isomerase [Ensifer soli]|uniref:AGE family epimerase/isomerase n=1 Tax=Ciceribacter sp. sgz301302 TaxID=3342379 RepID=UPI0035BB75E4